MKESALSASERINFACWRQKSLSIVIAAKWPGRRLLGPNALDKVWVGSQSQRKLRFLVIIPSSSEGSQLLPAASALNLIWPGNAGSISSRYAWRSALARSISDSARIGARLCFAISTRLSKSSQSSRVASIKLHIGNSPKSRLKNADVTGCSATGLEHAS